MAEGSLLDDAALAGALVSREGWRVEEGRLRRSFTFPTFARAMGFMTAAAIVAEGLDHHPEWTNRYRDVDVVLWTHDRGGITALDLRLASAMDKLAR